jgi:anti-sigma factor RsiW
MDCKKLVELISDYVDHELDADSVLELEKHIEECPNCRLFISSLRITIQSFSYSQQVRLPTRIHHRLKKRLQKHPRAIRRGA